MTTQIPDGPATLPLADVVDLSGRHRGNHPSRPITVGVDPTGGDGGQVVLVLGVDHADQLARLVARNAGQLVELAPYATSRETTRTWDAATVDLLTAVADLRDAHTRNGADR